MSGNLFDSFSSVKNALKKIKGDVVSTTTSALDVNKDGTIDIQDVIVLAVRAPGVYVNRENFLKKSFTSIIPKKLFWMLLQGHRRWLGFRMMTLKK